MTDAIKARIPAYWARVDAELGDKVAEGLGIERDAAAEAKVTEMAGRA